MSIYDAHFFEKIQEGALRSARATVPLVLDWIQPSSVVDVGCGNGAWLSVFRESGIKRVLGIDGDYVNRHQLLIPNEYFLAADLSKPPSIKENFDLAVCLEVAEHLAAEHAVPFIKFLTDLAPVILFSAAIPDQGGGHHVNEQWPEYWAAIFKGRGFMPIDCVRQRIWTNDDVEWWYAQNMLIFSDQSKLKRFPQLAQQAKLCGGRPLGLVHPKGYAKWVSWTRGIYEVVREITRLVPDDSTFIIVDEGQLIAPAYRNARPFLQLDGIDCGRPPNDDVAIGQLRHMIGQGAAFIAFCWPAFWWLDYYKKFAAHLRDNFTCLYSSNYLIVFDLQNGQQNAS